MEKLLSESNQIIRFFCTNKYICYLTYASGWVIYNIELKTKYLVPITIYDEKASICNTWITYDNKYVLFRGYNVTLLCITDNSLVNLTNFNDYIDDYHRVNHSFMYVPEKNLFYIVKIIYDGDNNTTKLFSYNPETKQKICITDNWTQYYDNINYDNKTYLVTDLYDEIPQFYDTDTFTENMETLQAIHDSKLYDELLNKYNELNKIIKQGYTYYTRKYSYIDYVNDNITYRKFMVEDINTFQIDYEANTIYSKHDNTIYKFDICNYLTDSYTLLNDYQIPPEIQNIIIKYN